MTSYGQYDESGTDYDAVLAKIRRAQALREGGHVQRLHTVPVVGDASVAKHSYNIALLLMILLPEYPPELMEAVLVHDSSERWIGDTPAPAKYQIEPMLGKVLKRAEAKVEEALGINIQLDEFAGAWLKGLDILEFKLYCEDQLALGNRNVEHSLDNVNEMLKATWVPKEIREFAANYVWERTRDVIGGETIGDIDLEEYTDH